MFFFKKDESQEIVREKKPNFQKQKPKFLPHAVRTPPSTFTLSLPIAKAAPSLSPFNHRRRSTTVARTSIRASQQPSQQDGAAVGLSLLFRRWATKKTAGSTKNGRDSKPKNLGVKKFGGERVIPGNIIVRQRGTRFHPGDYVGIGKDHTLFALKEGCVKFEKHKLSGRKWVHIVPKEGHVLHPVYATTSTSPELKTMTTT